MSVVYVLDAIEVFSLPFGVYFDDKTTFEDPSFQKTLELEHLNPIIFAESVIGAITSMPMILTHFLKKSENQKAKKAIYNPDLLRSSNIYFFRKSNLLPLCF